MLMHSSIDQYRRRQKERDQTKYKNNNKISIEIKSILITMIEFVKLFHKKRLRACFNKLVPFARI
jgi:hypothetical protein